LGLRSDAEILRAFYKCNDIVIKDKKLFWKVSDGLGRAQTLARGLTKGGDTVVPQGRKITTASTKTF